MTWETETRWTGAALTGTWQWPLMLYYCPMRAVKQRVACRPQRVKNTEESSIGSWDARGLSFRQYIGQNTSTWSSIASTCFTHSYDQVLFTFHIFQLMKEDKLLTVLASTIKDIFISYSISFIFKNTSWTIVVSWLLMYIIVVVKITSAIL